MSVAGIGSTNTASFVSGANSYFAQRNADAKQLAQSLKAGDLGGAEQAYQSLVSLGPLPGSSSTSGAPFSDPKLASDFQAIGQALESGSLSGAQQAFQTLQQDFQANAHTHGTVAEASPNTSPTTGINLTA